ncbi:MAG: hypothetical protein ORO03_06750, partial [Alphaproteobacteria bacterium]|nr:hypothetical protein [Alphaproteobacteria bacterium]
MINRKIVSRRINSFATWISAAAMLVLMIPPETMAEPPLSVEDYFTIESIMLISVSSTIFVLFILLVFMENQYFNLKLTKITNNCISLMKIRQNNNSTARLIWAAVYAPIYIIFIGLLFFVATFIYHSTLSFIKSIEVLREILDRKVNVLNGDKDINWKYLLILGISIAVLIY